MTWPDYVLIGLCLVIGFVESKRGFVAAICDMIGLIVLIKVVAAFYTRLVPQFSYMQAYLICLIVGLAIVVLISSLIKRYTQTDIGSFDQPLAGVLGLVNACILGHALYAIVILGFGGKDGAVYMGSVFAPQIYDLTTWNAFMDFMTNKVGSPDIAK
jgi:uncharacterized membrane protein required for colicin V production